MLDKFLILDGYIKGYYSSETLEIIAMARTKLRKCPVSNDSVLLMFFLSNVHNCSIKLHDYEINWWNETTFVDMVGADG